MGNIYFSNKYFFYNSEIVCRFRRVKERSWRLWQSCSYAVQNKNEGNILLHKEQRRQRGKVFDYTDYNGGSWWNQRLTWEVKRTCYLWLSIPMIWIQICGLHGSFLKALHALKLNPELYYSWILLIQATGNKCKLEKTERQGFFLTSGPRDKEEKCRDQHC